MHSRLVYFNPLKTSFLATLLKFYHFCHSLCFSICWSTCTLFPVVLFHLSRLMRKPTICICENKDADQLRGNREADQRLCFCYTDSTIPLLLNTKFKASSHLLCLYSPVCVRPVRKPHCWFSHEAAHFHS